MATGTGTVKTRGTQKKKIQKKVSWYKKKFTAKDIALKALEMAQFLKTIVNVETKKLDSTISTFVPSAGTTNVGDLWSLSSIDQGDQDYQRNGESVLLKSILIRGFVQATNNGIIRIMVIKDKARVPGSAIPSSNDILQVTGNSFAPLSPLDENAEGRFVVLHSSMMTFNTAGESSKLFKLYLDKQFHIKFSGPSSNDVNLNQVYILLISDKDGTTTVGPAYNLSARLSFYDN